MYALSLYITKYVFWLFAFKKLSQGLLKDIFLKGGYTLTNWSWNVVMNCGHWLASYVA